MIVERNKYLKPDNLETFMTLRSKYFYKVLILMRAINYDIDSEIFLPCHTHDIYLYLIYAKKCDMYIFHSDDKGGMGSQVNYSRQSGPGVLSVM